MSIKFQREKEEKFAACRVCSSAWAGVVWRASAGRENWCERSSGGGTREEGQSMWSEVLYRNRLKCQMSNHHHNQHHPTLILNVFHFPSSHKVMLTMPPSFYFHFLWPDTSYYGLYVQFVIYLEINSWWEIERSSQHQIVCSVHF